MKYDIHTELRNVTFTVPMFAPLLSLGHSVTKMMYISYPVGEDVLYRRKMITSFDGRRIPIGIYRPKNADSVLPCLFFIHGGGFALGAVDYHREFVIDYAQSVGCTVVDINYRLLPAHPYPYGFEDCYAAFSYLRTNADELKIDTARMGVCGDSAGGGLAAGLAQALYDREQFSPLFQMLVCPALDSTMHTESMKKYEDTPVWNAVCNHAMWKMYLNDTAMKKAEAAVQTGTADAAVCEKSAVCASSGARCFKPDIKYASPLWYEGLENLPSTYLETSEYDCLHDEGVLYAQKLKEKGVDVVLNDTKGTIHGFELAKKSAYRNEIVAQRRAYLKKMFSR